MYCALGPDMSKLLLSWPCQFFYSLLMTVYSWTNIEHHHGGGNCHYPRTTARNTHHSAAWICSHSSYTEGGAPWGHWDPCHSNSYHSCKREVLTLNAFVFVIFQSKLYKYFLMLLFTFYFQSDVCISEIKCHLLCMRLQETLENVKKCRNFLSTLIKLASSGKQSSETTANVKELVKNLLVNILPFLSTSPALC